MCVLEYPADVWIVLYNPQSLQIKNIYLIYNCFSVNVALSHAEWHYYACAMHFLTCEIRISMKTYHGMLQHVLPGIKA